LNNNYNAPSGSSTPICRQCQQAIELKNENDFLDNFGGFVRLRCAAPDCGHEDWYKEPVFQPAARVVRRAPEEGPGEVWVHDVMLGLSFKTESTQNHE
jgi:hypothetical protein